MSKVNLKDYKKENQGLLRKSVEERGKMFFGALQVLCGSGGAATLS